MPWGPDSHIDVNELQSAPFSMGTHESPGEHYGDHMGEEEHAPDVPLTRLQIFLQRTYGGWPLYTIIISTGQMLAAVSWNEGGETTQDY